MKPIKGTRKTNKKELKAIANYLATDAMHLYDQPYPTNDEAYSAYKKVLKKLTTITYELPKTAGVLVVVINVFKVKDKVSGLCYDKFVEQYLITEDEVKNVTDLDYIASDEFTEVPLPFGVQLINGEIAMVDENGPTIIDENPCARIPLPSDINEIH